MTVAFVCSTSVSLSADVVVVAVVVVFDEVADEFDEASSSVSAGWSGSTRPTGLDCLRREDIYSICDK